MAIFDFKAVRSNMIGLKNGDIYQVIDKHDQHDNPDWWLVQSDENNFGYVPRTYIKLLD